MDEYSFPPGIRVPNGILAPGGRFAQPICEPPLTDTGFGTQLGVGTLPKKHLYESSPLKILGATIRNYIINNYRTLGDASGTAFGRGHSPPPLYSAAGEEL